MQFPCWLTSSSPGHSKVVEHSVEFHFYLHNVEHVDSFIPMLVYLIMCTPRICCMNVLVVNALH